MTTLIVAAGGLILLSALFYLFPRAGRGGVEQDLKRANLEWYRLREAELAAEGGEEALQDDARLRLLEDEQQRAPVETAVPSSSSFPRWTLLPLIALFSSGLYYQLGAAPDVMIVRQLESLDDSTSPQQMQELITDIEARSAQRPDNLHYIALLGRYYMGEQDYSRAAQTYATLAREVPESIHQRSEYKK